MNLHDIPPTSYLLAMNTSYISQFMATETQILLGNHLQFMSQHFKALEDSNSSERRKDLSYILQLQDDIAIITVSGILVADDSWYNRYYGRLSYNEINKAIFQALEENVSAILFIFDSPGGDAKLLDDVAEVVSAVNVPTVTHASGQCASAAYFIGMQANYVYCSSMAQVGSIGVYAKVYDQSEWLKKLGVSVERFRTGDLKGAGDPDFSLSKKEKAYCQEKAEYLAGIFYGMVSDARGIPLQMLLQSEIKRGGVFIGEQAKAVGLVDNVQTIDKTMAKVYELAAKNVDTTSNMRLS